MRFIIRADASREIGAGHVMRVSAIAEELIDRGCSVIFVGNIEGLSWVKLRIANLRFSAIFSEPTSITPNAATDVLILDSYEIDPLSQFIKLEAWHKVVVIVDDSTPAYDGDLYINPGPGTTWAPPISEHEHRFLSGVDYLPIRKTIRSARRRKPSLDPIPVEIIVAGGGSDPFGFCEKFSWVLHTIDSDFRASVFIDNRTNLPIDSRINYCDTGKSFEESLLKADLVFTTAGTSSWELLSCGLPIGIALAVDNQLPNYNYQTHNHLSEDIGSRNSDGSWSFYIETIRLLITSPTIRKRLIESSTSTVDGRGAERIVDEIQEMLAQ